MVGGIGRRQDDERRECDEPAAVHVEARDLLPHRTLLRRGVQLAQGGDRFDLHHSGHVDSVSVSGRTRQGRPLTLASGMLIGLARIVAYSCASIRDCAALAGRAAVPALLAASVAGAATTPSTPAPAPAATSAAAPAAETDWVHAYAAFGTPKYPRNFTHFEYLNPEAPKSGTLYLRNPDRRTSFDKLNHFTVKGNAPAASRSS